MDLYQNHHVDRIYWWDHWRHHWKWRWKERVWWTSQIDHHYWKDL